MCRSRTSDGIALRSATAIAASDSRKSQLRVLIWKSGWLKSMMTGVEAHDWLERFPNWSVRLSCVPTVIVVPTTPQPAHLG